jgi:hypothetical protein
VRSLADLGERTTFVVGCVEEQASLYGLSPTEMGRIVADQREIEPLLRHSCAHMAQGVARLEPLLQASDCFGTIAAVDASSDG